MVNLTELRETAADIIRLTNKQQSSFSAPYIVAELVQPLLELLDAMDTQRGERWLTLQEAIRESGRSANYFGKPLRALSGRCRSRSGGWRGSQGRRGRDVG
jgi:hypothetical protein